MSISYENAFRNFKDHLDSHRLSEGFKGLYEPVSYLLKIGGKRLRPVALLMSNSVFGGDITKALNPALGIEYFHNFTLMHDDIMDKADLRRGKETVHKKWNVNQAILSGDVLFTIAGELVHDVDEEFLKEVSAIYHRTAREVCEGQQMDMEFEEREEVSIGDYLKMIKLKTAVLLGGAMEIGAVIAGASKEDAGLMYRFAIELGLAFQIRDDHLDAYGGEEFGKKTGGDIINGKQTFLSINARDKDPKGYEEVMQKAGAARIAGMLDIYRNTGVDEMTTSAIDQHYKNAVKALEASSVPNAAHAELRDLGERLIYRTV